MDPRFTDLLRPFLRFLGPEPIQESSPLRELGLDSMQAIDLLFAVEDAYGCVLPDDLMTDATFATAGSLWTAVRGSAAVAGSTPVGTP